MMMDSEACSWRPSQGAFSPYSPARECARVAVRRPLVARLSKDLLETYQVCNREFRYSHDSNPKRYLTTPSLGVLNDGSDNANSDLILTVNSLLLNFDTHRRYIVKDVLGHGTFGQVAKCWIPDSNAFVAVKIIKNQPAYYQQALVEVSILTTLNKKYDPEDKHHVVRIYDYFVHQRHLCICFELLDTNLYELLKMNHFRGLSLNIVQLFSKQILCGLGLLKDAGIIHCDLKPENILLCTSLKPAEVKIIDFGSACMEDRTVYSYIQSRYYRSPEVLLGYQYTTAIDMWSFGCIVAELFLGLPLFPGASEFDLLKRMIQILGGQPPDYLLKEAKNTTKFFKCIGSIHNIESGQVSTSSRSAYQAMTEDEYEAREMKKPSIGKQYFKHRYLEEIVTNYPYKTNLAENDMIKESKTRAALVDFLKGLVEFDPAKRWSPSQASKHPFVTGEPFTCPYKPLPETPRLAVGGQSMRVEHHPGGGHWFAAGLSPNVAGRNRMPAQNSYQQQMGQYGGSYGSSIGSYSEAGDANTMFAYYSPAMPPSFLGRVVPYPHHSGLGMSPTFAPLPLGTSPSQFTPPRGMLNKYNRSWHGPHHLFPPQSEAESTGTSGAARWKHGPHPVFPPQSEAESTGTSGAARWKHGPHHVIPPQSEGVAADPADWDPNYSDDLLLHDDPSELVADFARGVSIGSPDARFNHLPSTSASLPFQRGVQEGYSRSMPPPQSRLGQQRGRPRGGNVNANGNAMAWGVGPAPGQGQGQGRRPNHPPRGRREYGRIS